jgi:hypothetical protein
MQGADDVVRRRVRALGYGPEQPWISGTARPSQSPQACPLPGKGEQLLQCKQCGAMFIGKRRRRRCPDCRAERLAGADVKLPDEFRLSETGQERARRIEYFRLRAEQGLPLFPAPPDKEIARILNGSQEQAMLPSRAAG